MNQQQKEQTFAEQLNPMQIEKLIRELDADTHCFAEEEYRQLSHQFNERWYKPFVEIYQYRRDN